MKLNSTHIVLGALAALAAVSGVVLTVWPISSGEIRVVEVAPTVAPTPTSVALTSDTRVGVYISGAVVNPGVYIVNGGSRLANVLLLAGGAAAEADLTAVNLAVIVQDEDHWHIPMRGEVASPSGGLVSSSGNAKSSVQDGQGGEGKVDLNGAGVELLKTLPGIGDARAQAIVSYREANGDFASVDALLNVDGIGSGTVENIRELVTVE